jgi:hypothetical protein
MSDDKGNDKTKSARKGKPKPSKLYVSLDNADTVIEGGPLLPSSGDCGMAKQEVARSIDPRKAS